MLELGSLFRPIATSEFLPFWVESQNVSSLMKPPRLNSVAAKAEAGTNRAKTTKTSIVFFIIPPLVRKVVTNFSFPLMPN